MPAMTRTRTAALVVALWTGLGLLESSKAWVAERLRGGPWGFGWALVGNMPWWWGWALLTPLVFLLARRFRLDGPRWPRAAPVHLAAGTLLSLAHLAAVAPLYWYTHTRHLAAADPLVAARTPSAWAQFEQFVDNYLIVELATYGMVVALCTALDLHRRWREREVAALQLEARTAVLESQMAEARLHALRAELNPHFLFNALNAASGLVRRGEGTAAVEMLARLGELLRLTLERGGAHGGAGGRAAHEVPLGEELAVLRLYLDIERVRFSDRLAVTLDVPADAEAVPVPVFVLQPLVENAIRHGVAPMPGPGRVRVSARLEAGPHGGRLRLEVADSGPGFASRAVARGHGIGLANTRARLAALHGDAATLSTGQAPEGGALVVLELPARGAGAAVSAEPVEGGADVALYV
jgi:two-component system, LytTR family, sensor kinase